ncbi:hypothetical protein BC834DRAFT_623719 [Gloeopeniophorella convolvens]|nr:hypothetical protein BC834DRAFT_623719 [Gloeopeniophorella convolvens]
MATALVAQDHNGNVAKVWQRQPARYIDRIEISGDEITFIGQANYTVVFNVNEILLQRPPPTSTTPLQIPQNTPFWSSGPTLFGRRHSFLHKTK